MHLVTGYAGEEHIKSRDDGAFNAAFFGADQFVMESGSQFEASIIDNNTVRVLDGDLLMYGRHALIEPLKYEDITIKTGTAGKNRIDLIVVRYEKNTNDGTESTYLEVIQGTEAEIGAVPPEYTDGNILEGATMNQMPLYQVAINGVVLTSVTPLFITKPSYQALAAKYEEEFKNACKTHLDSLNVLDSMEEIEANTQEKQLAGALALKELGTSVKNSTLVFYNKIVSTSAFAEDATYEDYGYRASIPCTGVTSAYSPDVRFAMSEATSGIYAPVSDSGSGVVYIYASNLPEANITIPCIVCQKAGE